VFTFDVFPSQLLEVSRKNVSNYKLIPSGLQMIWTPDPTYQNAEKTS